MSIEDPFDQDDWEHYSKFTEKIGEKVQIVGDDLLVTNPKKIAEAISKKACNALLLKVVQKKPDLDESPSTLSYFANENEFQLF